MSIDSVLFRRVMRRFATGITLVTVRDGATLHAMTANSFASVSLNPTLVLVCIVKDGTTHALVSQTGLFAVNILSAAQQELAMRFAHQVPMPADPFADIHWHTSATGTPVLDDGIAYLDCKVVAAHDAGDHTIFIGEVLDAGFGSARDAPPLLYLDSHYAKL